MSDDRVQQVIDELNPTPASEAAWPVSRRQTLRALAAAGLLGAGSSSASAESVGGVIADEAVFSNYGSESVSDGWELTIDDDVFALTESEDTIGLPDGGVGEEVVLPSGAEASEMIAPDGSVVWERFAIPDSVVAQYDAQSLEDVSDGDVVTTWPDDVGGFDATGQATYRDSAINDNPALEFDGTDDTFEVDSDDWETVDQPTTAFVVVELADSSETRAVINRNESFADQQFINWQSGEWAIFAGNQTVSGSTDETRMLISARFDGSNSVIREEGSQTASGDAGDETRPDLQIGSEEGSSDFWDGYIGFVEIHDTGLSDSEMASREDEIANMWDISI